MKGDRPTGAEKTLPRVAQRLAAKRQTLGLPALLAIVASGAGLVRARWVRAASERLARRELGDALELCAVMIIDDQNVIRHWSRGCEELYGWSAEEAIGRKRPELLHSEITVPAEELWTRLRREGRLHSELLERHRDGRQLVIHDHVKLVGDGVGRYSAVISVTDVTEWRRAENALRLSEARLATAVSVQGIFIYELDLVDRRLIWATSGETFFGRALGSEDIAAMAAADGDAHQRQMNRLIESALASDEDRLHFEFDYVHQDGSPRLAEGWARIIRDDGGRAIGLLGTHLDVTERRERERALRAGEAERRAILATVPDALFVCTERGIVRACSAMACRMLGYGEQELLGRKLVDLVDDDRGRSAIRRDLAAAVNRGPDNPWPLPINIRRADGELVPISFVIGDAVVEGIRMFVVLGRDMRPAIASEERFRRMNNDLMQVSRLGMMGEMAAALAHELSQPLSAIVNFLGAVELMLENGETGQEPRLRHAIGRAGEQASRAGEIIRRLRAFILRGEADMRAEPLPGLAREAAALALFNSSAFGIRLAYHFEKEDRLVLCDRIQIQQVLVNLIRNAADAMATHGGGPHDLMLSTKLVRDNLIEVEVKDSGPGIDPEMLEYLFRPFTTTKREGLGFGLAISRRIVEAHGGQLSADSAPGGGASFRFTLQAMEDEKR